MFWFCQNPGMALPILALQFHEVRINVSIRPLLECLWAVTSLAPTSGANVTCRAAYQQSLVAASLFIDYTFCEVDERKFFVSTPHEYLIDQLQFTGDVTVGTASTRLPINMSHPVQELIFVCQPDINVDFCSSFEPGEPLFNQLGVQAFNYTDALDALPNAIHAFGSPDALNDTYDSNGNHATGNNQDYGFMAPYTSPSGQSTFMFQQPSGVSMTSIQNNQNALTGNYYDSNGAGSMVYNGSGMAPDANSATMFATDSFNTGDNNTASPTAGNQYLVGLSDPAIFVLAETAFHLHCWGENPIITCKLTVNNVDRFCDREGSYFDVVQPFQCHTRAASSGINVYSFAINPEALQPSGSLNFSRIDNAYLVVTLSAAAVFSTSTAKIRIYGRAKNLFRVIGGMAGVAFAS
jgi:hypothetical protein